MCHFPYWLLFRNGTNFAVFCNEKWQKKKCTLCLGMRIRTRCFVKSSCSVLSHSVALRICICRKLQEVEMRITCGCNSVNYKSPEDSVCPWNCKQHWNVRTCSQWVSVSFLAELCIFFLDLRHEQQINLRSYCLC